MAKDTSKRLTPKIRELVATDRLGRPPVGRLQPGHVEALAEVARDPSGYDESVSARRALTALATSAPPQDAVPVLTEVLSDPRAARADRIAAARGLARVATPEAAAALARHLRERDPRVQQAVLAALGQIGGPGELAEIGKLPRPADQATRRQLDFTRALIAHRHGLEGPFMPDVRAASPEDVSDDRRAPVAFRLQSEGPTGEDRDRLVGSTWGIELAERSYAVECGRASFTVFVNVDVGASVTSAGRVFERPMIAGVVAQRYPPGVRATPRFIVLTRPAGDGARLEVVRADGRIRYVGEITPKGTGWAFRVTNTEQPATADTLLTGHVTGRGVQLDAAFSSPRRDTPETTSALA